MMKMELLLTILGYVSDVIKKLYNKNRVSKPESIEMAKKGDQRGIENDLFVDSGKPSAVAYNGMSTRPAKDRGSLVD